MADTALNPTELKAQLDSPEPPCVLDVREAEEWEFCRIEGAIWIPLRELPGRVDELPRDRAIVCLCHHGMRSAMAQRQLLGAGFERVANLAGGIHAWSRKVDSSIPTY